MYKYILITSLVCRISAQIISTTNNYDRVSSLFTWKQLSYDFDGVKFTKDTPKRYNSESIYFSEEVDDSEAFFTQYNNVPIGFETYGNMLFITVPRRRFGIPSTLNYINIEHQKGKSSPHLKPYPNVECISKFVSVYRPRVDLECRRLWLVDTGLLEVPDKRKQVKPPEIIIFDLKTNKEILRYSLPSSVLSNGITSGLTSITVDVFGSCDDAYAYINDLATGGLIVFSLRDRDSWRFTHSSFTYDDGALNFTVGDINIPWRDGLFSIALSDPDSRGVRTAYYHPFVSTQEFSITTDVLKNKNGEIEKNFKLEGVRGPFSQSGSHDYHKETRTLLFANVARDGILCWNVDKPLTSKNTALVAQNSTTLSYISDLKVTREKVFVLVNHIPKFIYSKLDPKEVNFLVLWANVTDLIADTVCGKDTGAAKNAKPETTCTKFNIC